jgi:hypothetical protein
VLGLRRFERLKKSEGPYNQRVRPKKVPNGEHCSDEADETNGTHEANEADELTVSFHRDTYPEYQPRYRVRFEPTAPGQQAIPYALIVPVPALANIRDTVAG